MVSPNQRIGLLIDVFTLKEQQASVIPAIKPPELIAAILQEFHELEFLGEKPDNYQLVRLSDGSVLDSSQALDKQQVGQGERLALIEQLPPPPASAQPLAGHIYLRNTQSNQVYHLLWQPAILGRSDEQLPLNELVAVNLSGAPGGTHVSRRHAQITEQNGHYFIESLSTNPTLIDDGHNPPIPISDKRYPLQDGNTILLQNSQIKLKVIIRASEAAPQPPSGARAITPSSIQEVI